jgi:1-phosphatidylinositol phosphodiesterase
MSKVDDATNLAALSIPGTHESASLYEPVPGTAKCQNETLDEQLAAGVRYFDIRCRDLNDQFAIFHGPIDEQQTFDQVLTTMFDFLDQHPTETVIMSIKEESTPEGTTRSFEATFDTYPAQAPDRWYLGAAVPALGDVRGKIVLLRRFTAAAPPLGIDASMWADNTTFTIADPDAMLRVEDQYAVTSTSTKWMEITANLDSARAATDATLYLTYTSGYMTNNGLPNVPSVAHTIDPMLDTYLADPGAAHAHLGTMAIDFIDEYEAGLIAGTDTP